MELLQPLLTSFVLTISQKDWNHDTLWEILSSPKILCRAFVLNQDTFGTFVLNEGSRGALWQGHFLSTKCLLLSKYYFVLTTFSLSYDNLPQLARNFVDSTSGTSIGQL
eukprot:scaffold12546_cov110-Skeletonema_dohrnii-CCMP3373.AAC.3